MPPAMQRAPGDRCRTDLARRGRRRTPAEAGAEPQASVASAPAQCARIPGWWPAAAPDRSAAPAPVRQGPVHWTKRGRPQDRARSSHVPRHRSCSPTRARRRGARAGAPPPPEGRAEGSPAPHASNGSATLCLQQGKALCYGQAKVWSMVRLAWVKAAMTSDRPATRPRKPHGASRTTFALLPVFYASGWLFSLPAPPSRASAPRNGPACRSPGSPDHQPAPRPRW